MSVAHEPKELGRILSRAARINPDYPVVVSKFEVRAREIEIDAVADHGEIVLWAVSEHIEDAGVHSGDATLVLPPQTLYIKTIREIRRIAAAIARELQITGPFNIQFLAKLGAVKVIECNLRASRSFPFVSKVTGTNFAVEATNRMLGVRRAVSNDTLSLDYVGVKVPMFSFSRIVGADPMLGVEMTSTGEVGCLGADLNEALLHGLLATGFRFPTAGVLVSLGPIEDKYSFAEEVRLIVDEIGLPVYATVGTAERLAEVGVDCIPVEKDSGDGISALDLIEDGSVDLVINIPREYDEQGRPDGYKIRRRAVDAGISLRHRPKARWCRRRSVEVQTPPRTRPRCVGRLPRTWLRSPEVVWRRRVDCCPRPGHRRSRSSPRSREESLDAATCIGCGVRALRRAQAGRRCSTRFIRITATESTISYCKTDRSIAGAPCIIS